MATAIWRSGTSLKQALGESPERFDFFQAVRLLQHARRDGMAVGESSIWGGEAVEFAGNIGFAFAPSDIKSIQFDDTLEKPSRMVVHHLALAGAFGPLPATFGERLLDGSRRGDPQLLRFLDIFHHRLIALLFRARQLSRPALRHDAPWRHPSAGFLFALIGMATKGQRRRLDVPDQALLGFVGLLAGSKRSSHGLNRLVSEHFRVKVCVREHVGKWSPLAPSQRTVLGRAGQNNRLGTTTIVGKRAWNQAAGLRLEIGPLGRKQFAALLPEGNSHKALRALIFFATDRRFEVEIRLSPSPDAISQLRLNASRLGHNSWLGRPERIRGQAGTPVTFSFSPRACLGGESAGAA